MKNTIKKLLELTLALVFVLGLVACAPAPKMDLEDAQENLEDEDYYVYYSEDGDESEGIEESLYGYNDDDMIVVVRFAKASTARLYYSQMVSSKNRELKSSKTYLKYKEHILKTYSDDMDSDMEDSLEDSIENLEDEIKETKDIVIGMRGKVVWYGTKDAIKDSKG